MKNIIILMTMFFSLWADCTAQDYRVPVRTPDNLIVASYNIKWFGNWTQDYKKLAKVIQNFDVCGIVEIKNEKDIPKLVKELDDLTGKTWGYIYGVRTHRPHGTYYEAYAAVYRKDRVEPGDGLVSNVWDLEENYRNDPYIVSFRKNNFDFMMLLIHTRWGVDSEGSRSKEVTSLVNQVNFINSITTERDILIAGDFNYSGTNEYMKKMASELNFKQVDPNAKSTFKGDFSGYNSSYDHIYLSPVNTVEFLQNESAVLDATLLIYGDDSASNMELSQTELSDHLPVWAVFDVSKADDD